MSTPRRTGWLPHPILSALLALVFLLLYESVHPAQVLWAVILGVAVPWLVQGFLGPASRVHAWDTALRFTFVVLWDIVMSNVTVARIVLDPSSRPRPAWVPVPLDLRHEGAVTLLASIITMTPGTVSCVVDDEDWTILVHALDCDDPPALAAQIKQRYEAPLREIFEGDQA
ncbi:MAG: Na+/H+ antiporter subunit E [Burkholderiaceae bacterium]|jgi:multicomponent K+:H+ antiporter subunit E|nr:Na+/H+ antiporter subunit E [Burkholderiaceae bacterium]